MTIHNSQATIGRPQSHNSQLNDDLLWRQIKTIPAFRALLRAVESRFYQAIELPGPTLDVGCGDGHFSQMSFADPITAGIDPWWGPLQKSQKSGMYRVLAQSVGDRMPFPDDSFASAFSNSVLEHIADVQPVLNEVNRVMRMDGRFVITMPSHYFTEWLGGAQFLQRLGLNGLADGYRRFANKISRHVHTDPPDMWMERLARAGFAVERWQYYFSPDALHALEWGHVQGLPAAIMHTLTGHWIVAPWESSLRRTEQWVRPFFEEPFAETGAYLLFIARKTANHAIEPALPPARPFTAAEFPVSTVQYPVSSIQSSVSSLQSPISSPQPPAPSPQSKIANPKSRISAALLALSLLFAMLGQSVWRGQPAEPGGGLRWLGFSLLTLAVLAVYQGWWRLPALPHWERPFPRRIPRRRWYILLAFALAFVARQQGVGGRPSIAFLAWFVSIGAAVYALQEKDEGGRMKDERPNPKSVIQNRKSKLLFPAALFLIAFIVRAVNLANFPFILNGIEASLGLDALNVTRGFLRNPFATGWLTNPTLPAFLLAIPIKLLGPSVTAARLWSPLVGAATVVAVYHFGRRLWSREVGLIAAVLLAGSPFHLHYSRLGMSNIWDPLLTLLALGALALAWRDETANRRRWLAAGLLTGLNAYFFTSSHLLPLMLAILLALAILFDRARLRRLGRHVLATAVLALIVALPQMLHYQANPTIFMERANAVGILAGQTYWLAQEAARAGASQGQILREQVWRGLLAFNYGRDHSPAYRPFTPLLSFGPAVLFLVGLMLAVLRRRHWANWMLAVWVLVTAVFGGALLLEPPTSHRLLIAAPALSLLAALALVEMGRWAATAVAFPPPSSPPAVAKLLPILLVIAALFTLGDIAAYFGRYPSQNQFADRNTEIADRMARYLNTLDESEWTVYFFGPPSMYVGFPTIPFLAPEFQGGVNLFDVHPDDADLPAANAPNLAFIFLPERADDLGWVQQRWGDGRAQTSNGYYASPLFTVYEVRK